MNNRQLKIEEDDENSSSMTHRTPDSSLWHYQPIKGLSFFQELIVISVVTVLGCVFTLTRLDFSNPDFDTNNTEGVRTGFSSLASMGTLSAVGTIEDRFLSGMETPSLVRRFSSKKNSLEWFASYPHTAPDVSSKTHTDFIPGSGQATLSEKRSTTERVDVGNLREVLKLIAGDIYANNANSSPDQYQIPEKWRTSVQGDEIIYKKYNQNSAVVYRLNADEEDHGLDKSRPFYAMIWPPNNHPAVIAAITEIKKSFPAPKRPIVSKNKNAGTKKPLEIGHIPQLLGMENPSPAGNSPPKKNVSKKEGATTIREETSSLSTNFQAPIKPVVEKIEAPAPAIQVTEKNLSPHVPTLPEPRVQKSISRNPKDSLIDKITALKPEETPHLTTREMKAAHLVWFTQGIRKLLSEEQLKVTHREQWVYLSDVQIHRMSAEMRNSLGEAIRLFQPERVEKMFSIPQIESFLEANIDRPEALSALTERMSAGQIAGISNTHFSVIVHWLNPIQISFAQPEQIAMLSREAYARLDFSQRAAFTPLQRAAEARIVLPNAPTQFSTNTIDLTLSSSGENQKTEKKMVALTQYRKVYKKEGTGKENPDSLTTSTETDIEDVNIPDPVQAEIRTRPVRMSPKLNVPVLSISEIRDMEPARVIEIAPQQIHTMTARGNIHYFSEVQIRVFTARQINSALSSTRKNGELAYLMHRFTPAQIKMIAPILCKRIYLDWIPENGRKGLAPQQLASLRIGDPAYLSYLTSQQLSNLSLNQIILTGKKGGIQYLSDGQIQTMTSAQITAFISEVTNSGQLAYLVHRLTASQIKALAPRLTKQIYLDWISENVRRTLSPEQITTIRIGDPKHLSSLTREQVRLLDSKKLAEIKKKGGVKYLSQLLSEEDAQKNISLSFLINPKKSENPFRVKT